MRGPVRTPLALALCLLIAGCATIGPPQPPSLELPRPPTDLRATRKGDKVGLSWTIPTLTTDRQTVSSVGRTRVCRGLDQALAACDAPVGEAPPPNPAAIRKSAGQRTAASYTDELPSEIEHSNPLGFMTYAVEVLNGNGRGAGFSNQVQVPLVPTLPPPEAFSALITGDGVVLSWTGPRLPLNDPAPVRHFYRVYRRQEGSQLPVLVGQLGPGVEASSTLVDRSFEWEKTYYYHATTVSVMARPAKPEIQVEGDDTPTVRLFAHDVFPPAVPSGLQAVFSGPGQEPFIDLIWGPVSDVDLAGYNVYRHQPGKPPGKVNSELVKAPAYRDKNVISGREYFYSVSAVDVRGNESTPSEEASERVP